MREIAAASDFDFVALEPRRPEKGGVRKGARAKAERGNKSSPSRFGALWRYRTPAIGGVVLIGLLAAVAINALFLQHGRHPAPLFGATFKIAPPAPPPRPNAFDSLLNEEIPQGALKPVDPAQEAAFAAPAATEPPAAAEAPQPAPVAPPHKGGDMLGALIADDGVVTPEMRAAAAARATLSAQKALAKLGLPVTADGDYGAATRRAVEAFQRANHLPVTGELNAKTRRALSARSGLKVE